MMAAETPRCACTNKPNGAYQHTRHPYRRGQSTPEDKAGTTQISIEEGWESDDLGIDEDMDDYHRHVRSASRCNTRQGHNIDALPMNAAGYLRLSTEDTSPTVAYVRSMTITRQEFEALPITIQRKCFSTLERLRFAQELEASQEPPSSIVPFHDLYDPLPIQGANQQPPIPDTEHQKRPRRCQRQKATPSALDLASRNQPRFKLSEERFYVNLPDKIKRRHLSEGEQLIAQHYPRTVLLDAADKSLIKAGRVSKSLDLHDHSAFDPYLRSRAFSPAAMSSRPQTAERGSSENTDSFLNTIHLLDSGEDLDLSLCLQDYHSSIKDEPLQIKNRRPYFRRHLSISKLSSLSRSTVGNNETFFRDSSIAPSLRSAPSPVPSTPIGHDRKKSRTLSLIPPNKQYISEFDEAQGGDSGASHYQDPEARMKLRVYLASPQKFDEALEFGFPSLDEERHEVTFLDPIKSADERNEKWLSTFLDDDKSSICSDGQSAADPESPRTPPIMDGSMTLQPPRADAEITSSAQVDYAQAPLNSREMTLRMTLTRPDLRSNEDQIYGWQSGPAVRKTHARGDSFSPMANAGGTDVRGSIERHFAALDQENAESQEHGMVKRLWKRVRRT